MSLGLSSTPKCHFLVLQKGYFQYLLLGGRFSKMQFAHSSVESVCHIMHVRLIGKKVPFQGVTVAKRKG